MQIYLITNVVNGKYYVGKTVDAAKRLREHLRAHGDCKRLHPAIKKYGAAAFVLDILSYEGSDDLERLWIAALDSRNKEVGYNIMPGGEGFGAGALHPSFGKVGATKGMKFSAAACRNMREGARRRKKGPLTEKRKAHLRVLRDAKIGIANEGARKYMLEHNPMRGIVSPNKGKHGEWKMSEDTKRRMKLGQQARRQREAQGNAV